MERSSLDDPYKRLDYRRQIAWPTRTTVAPSVIASSKSPDMPMDR